MTKRGLIITLIGLVLAAIGTVILIRFLTRVSVPVAGSLTPTNNEIVQPPATNIVPQSATKGVETWTGVLSLENGAILKVDTKVYSLLINKTDASYILKAQGYKTGDEVNVMGKASKEVIEVAGVNLLIK